MSKKQQCIFCGGPIFAEVRFCQHCGRPVSLRDQFFAGFRTFCEISSFMATAFAIIFLVLSTSFTRDQLKLQREVFEREQQQSNLQDSINRTHLELLAGQLEETRKASGLQEQAFRADSQKIREERRPILEIQKIDLKKDSLGNSFVINLRNYGLGVASECMLITTIREFDSQRDVFRDTTLIDNIIKDLPRSIIMPMMGIWPQIDYMIRTEAKYTWTNYNLQYNTDKYFKFSYRSEASKCTCYSLSKDEAYNMWRK